MRDLAHFLGRLRKWANAHQGTCFLLGVIAVWLSFPGIPAPAAAALEDPDKFELLSLDTSPGSDGDERFHGYRILGKTTLTEPSAQRRVSRLIRWGARLNYIPPPFGNACFSPRHAVRVTHGGATTDILICFECRHVQVYFGDFRNVWFDICGFPEPALDEILQKAGVPLAPKGH